MRDKATRIGRAMAVASKVRKIRRTVKRTSTGSTRNWWAHRVHHMTGGAWTADYLIGLAVEVVFTASPGLTPIVHRAA